MTGKAAYTRSHERPARGTPCPGMRSRKKARFRIFLAGAGFCLALSASARVFLLERRPHGATDAGRPGWAGVYEANITLNGAAGRVEVLGVDATPAETRALLDRAYRELGMEVAFFGAGEWVWGVAFDSDRVVRFLVLTFSPHRECLVFRLDQSRDAFHASIERPRAHRVASVPHPPDGHVRFHATNEDVGLQVETSESLRSARDLARYYASRMPAEGWILLTPRNPREPDAQGLWYARDNRLAIVHFHDDGRGRTQVTRIVRPYPSP